MTGSLSLSSLKFLYLVALISYIEGDILWSVIGYRN